MARFVVAIDGTAGSGKSTTAQALAQRLNFFYLDTGAMYRAFTLNLIRNGFALNIDKIKNLLAKTRIDLVKAQNGYQVLLNGQDVSLEIRTPEVNEKVSQVSAIPLVREWMVEQQRRIAQDKCVVCEGRDIGTVVFPDADVKIFMMASLEERARRRQKELNEKKISSRIEEVKENLAFRDEYDTQREHSPLRVAEGAVIIDTTNLSIEEEIELALKEVQKRLPAEKVRQ